MKKDSKVNQWVIRLRAFNASLQRLRCLYLLILLATVLVLYPYLTFEGGVKSILAQVAVTVLFLSGVYAVSRKRWQFILAVLFLVPAMVGNWMEVGAEYRHLGAILNACRVVFFAFTSVMILTYVFQGTRFAADKIFGALSVYLLIGFAFASLYQSVYTLDPNSFDFSGVRASDGSLSQANFIYLSFVTQTTLGYGDITPATPGAGSLVVLQATTGVLYTAVLIAALVGSLRPVRPEEKQDGEEQND